MDYLYCDRFGKINQKLFEFLKQYNIRIFYSKKEIKARNKDMSK